MRVRPIRLALPVQILLPLNDSPLISSRVQQLPGQLLRQMNGPLLLPGRLQNPFHGQEVAPLLGNRNRYLILDTTTTNRCQLQQWPTVLNRCPEDLDGIRDNSCPLLIRLCQVVPLQLRSLDILKRLLDQIPGQLLPAALHDVIRELGHDLVMEDRGRVIVPGSLNRHMGELAGLSRVIQRLLLVLFVNRFDEVRSIGGHAAHQGEGVSGSGGGDPEIGRYSREYF